MSLKLSLLLLASMVVLIASCPVEETDQGQASEPVDSSPKNKRETPQKVILCLKTDIKRIGELSGKPAEYIVKNFLPLLTSFGLPSNLNELMGLWQGVYASFNSIVQSLFSIPLSIISQVAPGFGEMLTNLIKSFGGAGNPFQMLLSLFQNMLGGVALASRDVEGGDRNKRSLDLCVDMGDPKFGLIGDIFNVIGAQYGPSGIVDQFYQGVASNNLAGLESVPKAASGLINAPVISKREAAQPENPILASTVQMTASTIRPLVQLLNNITGGLLSALLDNWNAQTDKEVFNVQVKVSINDKPVSGPISELTGQIFSVEVNDNPLGLAQLASLFNPIGSAPSS